MLLSMTSEQILWSLQNFLFPLILKKSEYILRNARRPDNFDPNTSALFSSFQNLKPVLPMRFIAMLIFSSLLQTKIAKFETTLFVGSTPYNSVSFPDTYCNISTRNEPQIKSIQLPVIQQLKYLQLLLQQITLLNCTEN